MSSENQLSLFEDSTLNQKEAIPTHAKVPIPPGTYQTIKELAEHCNNCQRCELGKTRQNAVV
ncbi:MAG: uracil-DNA glycosylase, partial [Rivularia sp. (in: cyanobacteria)]